MIKASGPKRRGGQDGAVPPMFPIQQAVEAGWTVEAGKTQPVNRPAAGYERTRPAVANEGVVVDRGIGRQGEASGITKSPIRRGAVTFRWETRRPAQSHGLLHHSVRHVAAETAGLVVSILRGRSKLFR